MMQPLLRRLVLDVPHLTDHSKMPLKVNAQAAAATLEHQVKKKKIVFIDLIKMSVLLIKILLSTSCWPVIMSRGGSTTC